jgi:hypothetical protein
VVHSLLLGLTEHGILHRLLNRYLGLLAHKLPLWKKIWHKVGLLNISVHLRSPKLVVHLASLWHFPEPSSDRLKCRLGWFFTELVLFLRKYNGLKVSLLYPHRTFDISSIRS